MSKLFKMVFGGNNMNNEELETISNSLKGVSSILLMMSEAPDGSMIWHEWSLDLLYREVNSCVERLGKLNGLE